jgi:hypothetical protein
MTLPTMAVTRTISAFATVGCTPVGQTVALNGAVGKIDASLSVRLVPLEAGDGATVTVPYAKLRC